MHIRRALGLTCKLRVVLYKNVKASVLTDSFDV